MAYPEKVLVDDEEIVAHLHPHWKTLVLPVIVLLVLAGLTGFGLAWVGNATGRLAIGVVAVVLLLWLVVAPVLRWRTTHFVLTTRRVLIRRGVLSRTGRDVPLSRINDISFEHSLFERMLGCGTLVVESAGERGQVVLADVPHVERVQGELYQLAEDDADRRDARRTRVPDGHDSSEDETYDGPADRHRR